MNIDEALDLVFNAGQGKLAPQALAHLPEHLQERIAQVRQYAEQSAAAIRLPQSIANFSAAAASSRKPPQKVMWLHKAAQAFADAYAPIAACRDGCSHCCHVPVQLSQVEANFIASRTGYRAAQSDRLAPMGAIRGYESPCPFLAGSSCSIYPFRPIVCRSYVNLDRDSLLCELTNHGAPVPLANAMQLQMDSFNILGGTRTTYADIRQWFGTAALDTPPRQSETSTKAPI